MGRFAMGWPVGSIGVRVANEQLANACRGGQHCGADVKARAVFLSSRVPTTLPLVAQFSLTRAASLSPQKRGDVESGRLQRAPLEEMTQ
jgi:hypothetical protein